MIFGGQERRVGGLAGREVGRFVLNNASDVRFLFVIHPSSARALVLGAAYLIKKQTKKLCGAGFKLLHTWAHIRVFCTSSNFLDIFSNVRLIRSLDDIR